jgi:hypothetical protein
MNRAGRVRCNMRAQIKLCAGYCNPNWIAAVAQLATTPSAAAALWQVSTRPRESRGGSGRLSVGARDKKAPTRPELEVPPSTGDEK